MSTLYSQDTDLAKYFTDVEPLRVWFDQAVVAETLPKRLLVLWGVGGIGKSSLLRMFRLSARSKKIPVGLASGDEAKSAVDVLARWADDLKSDGANLPTFFKTYEHYRAIQAQVEDKAKAANKKWGDAASKAAGKAAEAGAAAAVGAVVGSVIPGIGTVAGAVGGMGAEALVDWLRGFLTKPDIDLYLDPTKKLTDEFLADLDKLAARQRVVLMLDTYEQMTALDDWTCDFAQRINPNVLMVIAGRAMPDWARQWPSWLMYAQVEELKPMTKRVMHELIRRYYATMRGGEPDPKQVNAIIEFSGGLPMVVNTAVQLWVKYGVEDFGAVKGEVVKAVVERLREGVPPELYPLLETAAALRYFNKDILRAVSGIGDISAGYEELLRFPFVRRRAEGYALHDRVREMMEENVRTDDPTKYRNVHESAAVYFEVRMAKASGEGAEQLGLEQLYHRACADEDSGVLLLQKRAEELAKSRRINDLQILLNNIGTIKILKHKNILWIQYYTARLAHLDARVPEAEESYRRLSAETSASSLLRAYCLCDLGEILAREHRLREPNGVNIAAEVIRKSLELVELDPHLIESLLRLARIARYGGNSAQQSKYWDEAGKFYKRSNDFYGLASLSVETKREAAISGHWKGFLDAHVSGISLIEQSPVSSVWLRTRILANWVWVWSLMGRHSEGERLSREAIEISDKIGDQISSIAVKRDLGWSLGFQERWEESRDILEESILLAQKGEPQRSFEVAAGLAFQGTVLVRSGHFTEGLPLLLAGLDMETAIGSVIGILASLVGTAIAFECEFKPKNAEEKYRLALEWEWYRNRFFECSSYTGLARVKHSQGEWTAIPPPVAKAEQLAQQYEYNDHLASLRLTQGHVAWDGHIPEWGKGFDAAFEFYKLALVYALRYNRFLLDEVLSGRPQGTPLRPIIPECLKRGDEGRKMLMTLRDWWQTGLNDVGTPRPDTISPIPENIPLLEAEKIAREREPGDGSAQTNVVARIDAALAN